MCVCVCRWFSSALLAQHFFTQPRCVESVSIDRVTGSGRGQAQKRRARSSSPPLAGLSCVSCVLFRQATVQSGKERRMEGGREPRQLPVNAPANFLEPVAAGFSSFNLKLAWASAKDTRARTCVCTHAHRRTHSHACAHTCTLGMRISRSENQPINCFHTVNRIKRCVSGWRARRCSDPRGRMQPDAAAAAPRQSRGVSEGLDRELASDWLWFFFFFLLLLDTLDWGSYILVRRCQPSWLWRLVGLTGGWMASVNECEWQPSPQHQHCHCVILTEPCLTRVSLMRPDLCDWDHHCCIYFSVFLPDFGTIFNYVKIDFTCTSINQSQLCILLTCSRFYNPFISSPWKFRFIWIA